jgi:hypothetical protein
MKNWEEHISELRDAILACREFCGDERNCIKSYLADNGIPKGSAAAIMIADKARIEANRTWGMFQREAGVTEPIDDAERKQITRILNKS